MSKRHQSNLIALIVLGIAIFFFIQSFSVKVDGTYPKVLCVALFVCAIVTVIQAELEARHEAKLPHHELTEAEMTTEELAEHMAAMVEETVPWQDMLALLIISFGSLMLWRPISFFFAGGLAILVLSLYKRRPPLKSLILAVCTAAVIQIIFRNIFTIPLPSPSWWPRF